MTPPPPQDFYTVLSLPSSKRHGQPITAVELRQAYKRALLRYHPDKSNTKPQQNGTTKSGIARQETPTIDIITEAVRVLSDSTLRKAYDLSLLSSGSGHSPAQPVAQTRHTGLETLDLEDFECDEDSGEWKRDCRCQSSPAYVVTEEELEESVEVGELVVGCQGCSLWVRVLFAVEG
jgi:diphthamide biosynthesis protein 4